MVEVMKKVSKDYVVNAKVARKKWPNAVVLDVTMEGGMKKLDPSFPIGKIKVPGIKNKFSCCVSGIWESLKVFEKKKEIDLSFCEEKKAGKKRGCKSYGRLVGVKLGEEVMEIDKGIEEVFVKGYKKCVKEKFETMIEGLKEESLKRPIVLLDYNEEDARYPVSHAEILKELIME